MDVEQVAGRLTEAQKEMMLAHMPGYYFGSEHEGWSEPTHSPRSWSQAGRTLMRLNLIKWHPSQRDSRTQLTAFGTSVRAHLQAQPTR